MRLVIKLITIVIGVLFVKYLIDSFVFSRQERMRKFYRTSKKPTEKPFAMVLNQHFFANGDPTINIFDLNTHLRPISVYKRIKCRRSKAYFNKRAVLCNKL